RNSSSQFWLHYIGGQEDFIFLHSEDYITAQIFTLIHELAHLFINESGVVGELLKNHSNRVETFCNQVASRFLLTENELNSCFDLKYKNIPLEMPKEKMIKTINKISNRFFISKLSILLRLKEQQIIKDVLFNNLWNEFYKEMTEWIKHKKQTQANQDGGNFYNTMISRTNRNFIKIVYSAYQTKNITGSQASSLLSLKVDKFKTLMKRLRKNA
ncbi:MAG: ImmA/IrrE family metallo-endopeptidase, partial [Oligoflexia bacterium]|nr:ImmA/IrrE family metallo-endopeptidase [Oligoflexia bacterium]